MNVKKAPIWTLYETSVLDEKGLSIGVIGYKKRYNPSSLKTVYVQQALFYYDINEPLFTLPYYNVEKVIVCPDRHFICVRKQSDLGHSVSFMHLSDKDEECYQKGGQINNVRNYQMINPTTIQVNVFDPENPEVLSADVSYLIDALTGKKLALFHQIESFKPQEGFGEMLFARAVIRISYGEEADEVIEVECYIDETGEIRTPLEYAYNGEIKGIDTAKLSFNLGEELVKIAAELTAVNKKGELRPCYRLQKISPEKIS